MNLEAVNPVTRSRFNLQGSVLLGSNLRSHRAALISAQDSGERQWCIPARRQPDQARHLPLRPAPAGG
jgi:hypothetical protein